MSLTPQEEYYFKAAMPLIGTTPTVFDIGAHKGLYSDFVKEKVPGAECYLFEPNIKFLPELSVKHKNISPLIISSEVGQAAFFECADKADEMSSIYKRRIFEQVEYIQVEKDCTTLDHFCQTNNIPQIDFLKIDVEGAELDVLKGCLNLLDSRRIKFIQVEYGGTYPDAGITFTDIIKFVGEYGYNVYRDKLERVTIHNFVEDYSFNNFLITYYDLK